MLPRPHLLLLVPLCGAQFGFLQNILRPFRGGGGGRPSSGGGLFGGGLQNLFSSPPGTPRDRPGQDSLFPDCGRQDNGRGALCFGDAVLCNQRKFLLLLFGFIWKNLELIPSEQGRVWTG